MEKIKNQKHQEAKSEQIVKPDKSKEINVDLPRLTCDYLDQTLQIA